MTIYASDFINDEVLERLAVISEPAIQWRESMHFINWLTQFRTFSLGLARQTGKTTTVAKHLNEQSLAIVPNFRMVEYMKQLHPTKEMNVFSSDTLLRYAVERIQGTDKVFSTIFMDELDMLDDRQWDTVYEAILVLYYGHHLTDNVFVMKVGTPVR